VSTANDRAVLHPATSARALPNQKVAVLIDNDNLNISAMKTFGRRVDFVKLFNALNDREVVRALVYHPVPQNTQNCFPAGLQHYLETRLGFEFRNPPKNVDCWLTVDAISLASKVDVIVLVAGDGDYEPLAHYLRSQGCKVEVWSWAVAMSQRLRQAADRYVPLTVDLLLPKTEAEVTPKDERAAA
jgi:uncharacterized LabA/DUF88 family protein